MCSLSPLIWLSATAADGIRDCRLWERLCHGVVGVRQQDAFLASLGLCFVIFEACRTDSPRGQKRLGPLPERWHKIIKEKWEETHDAELYLIASLLLLKTKSSNSTILGAVLGFALTMLLESRWRWVGS